MKNNTTGRIAETLQVGPLRIVRMVYDRDDAPERSVFAYDASGQLVWQIEAPPFRTLPTDLVGYADLRLENGTLIAGVTSGYDVEVSLQDGSVKMRPPTGRRW